MGTRITAFDVLLKGARSLATKPDVSQPELRPKRCTSGGDSVVGCSSKKIKCQDDEIVKLVKRKVDMLKKAPTSFEVDSIATYCCLDGEGEGEGGQRNLLSFVFMCLAFELVSMEPQRSVITNIACNMLRIAMSSSQEDLLAILCLSSYKIAPAYEGGGSDQLGSGEHNIIKAMAEAYGTTEKRIKLRYQEVGDLGLVAQTARSSQSKMFSPKSLSVSEIYYRFREIAEVCGKGSKEKKKNILKRLLAASRDCEPKYLIRLLLPKQGLRIGFSEATLIEALGRAAVFLEKENPPSFEQAAEIVKRAYAVLPVYERIVPALFSSGVRNLLKTCGLSLGIPIEPMLSKAIGSVDDVVKKFGNLPYTCEYKYDGERAQIHFVDDGRVEIYSRNLERSTGKYPDVALAVSRVKRPSAKSFILDCEIVAYDRDKKKILSFQKLSTRGRKNVDIDDIKVNACIVAFDLLYLDGQSLMEEQLCVRRKHLLETFEEEPGYLQFATTMISSDSKELQDFLEASVSASCEGLIFKALGTDSKYDPGKRNWLKLKKDFIESMWDSLDLVPIGAYYGSGKRTGVYGKFLLACYDPDNEEFQTICKAGTGLSDQMLGDYHDSLRSKVITSAMPYYKYNADKVQPDVWFEPSEVWEVKAGGLTISPVHSAAIGLVDPHKGLSLRNPTVLRVRGDKAPKQASTAEQVAEMYSDQWKSHPCFSAGEDEEIC